MAGISLERAEQQLQLWLDADEKVSKGVSYSIAGRSLTRANATEITEKIEYWERKIRNIRNSGRIRSVGINL